MITATYQPRLPDRKNFGIKQPDFGMNHNDGTVSETDCYAKSHSCVATTAKINIDSLYHFCPERLMDSLQ